MVQLQALRFVAIGALALAAAAGQEASAPVDTKPAQAFLDRTADGVLFGTSSDGLYRSTDSGASWERLVEQTRLGAVFAYRDGTGVVVATVDGLSKWEREEPVLVPVLSRGASEKGVAEFFWGSPPPGTVQARKGRLWIATSYDTDGDAEAERRLRGSHYDQVSPHFTGLVYSSADDGHTWKVIDRHQGAVPKAMWLGTDDVVRICMSDGALRTAALDPSTGDPLSPGFTSATAAGTVGGAWADWVVFPEADEGWAGGLFYYGGSVFQRSEDGGQTWQSTRIEKDDERDRKVVQAFLLGGGSAVRVLSVWKKSFTVEAWDDGAFHESRRFDLPGLKSAHVDATGCLLVRENDGETWRLASDARTWSRIGRIPLPEDR